MQLQFDATVDDFVDIARRSVETSREIKFSLLIGAAKSALWTYRREAAISGNKKSSFDRESPHSLLILTRDIRRSQISINFQALFLRARSKVKVLG
jgi:hypothetical protein